MSSSNAGSNTPVGRRNGVPARERTEIARSSTTNPPAFEINRAFRLRVGLLCAMVAGGIACLVLLVNLSHTDSARVEGTPAEVRSVLPADRSLASPLDDVVARIDPGYTGVLVIDGTEIPEDQLARIDGLGQIVFSPGPEKEFTRFDAGVHEAELVYWSVLKSRETDSRSFSWQFRTGA